MSINLQTLLIKTGAVAAVMAALWFANQHFIVKPAVVANNAEWQARWNERNTTDALAAVKQEKQAREKEQSLQAAADAAQRQADVERDRLARDLANSRVASERLRQGVADAIGRLQRTGSTATSSAGSSSATTGPGLLLAELYGEIDAAAGRLAAEADERGRRGLICEKLWDNARQTKAR